MQPLVEPTYITSLWLRCCVDCAALTGAVRVERVEKRPHLGHAQVDVHLPHACVVRDVNVGRQLAGGDRS